MKLLSLLLLCFLMACSKSNRPEPEPDRFAKGADLSWITEMEAAGKRFYSAGGQEMEAMALIKDLGLNTVRLRVWVNPAGGWNGKADVLAKARRAQALGLRLLIDFHYSDSWADPGQQNKPAAWAGLNPGDLQQAVSVHTIDVLQTLKSAGTEPEWVQVGNETNNGFLWPEGRASTNMAGFAQLVNAGYDAVKSVFPSAKVIVHLSNGWDASLYRWLFDGLKAQGGKWDVIGLSLYPSPSDWSYTNDQAYSNMTDMINRYGSEVMVVETGMSWDQPVAAFRFLSDLIARTRSLPGGKGLGVLYWEPQAYGQWQGYTLGAFDNSGRPTEAMGAFR